MCRATATAHKNKTAKQSTTNGYENYNYFLWLIDGCRSVNKLCVYVKLPSHTSLSSIYLSWLNYAMDTLNTFKIYKSVVYVSWVDASKGWLFINNYFKVQMEFLGNYIKNTSIEKWEWLIIHYRLVILTRITNEMCINFSIQILWFWYVKRPLLWIRKLFFSQTYIQKPSAALLHKKNTTRGERNR